ncbi:MAG: inositol monophosphatase family protein [Actinomycetota bacterium]
MPSLRDLAVRLAERAAAIHGEGREHGFTVGEKSSATDLVTEVDRAAERAIVDGILAERPADAILGEEGTDRDGTTGVRWVIDPLDGTANYVRDFPSYCVSIGVEVDGAPAVGVIVDARGVRTVGVRGIGATRDDRPIHPSTCRDLALAVLATGFGYDPVERERQAKVASIVLPRVADIRRSGSAAFDLVAAASGGVDAYYEVGLSPWDLSGGQAIVEAAGGVVATIPQPEGKDLVVATPAQLLEPILRLLEDAGLRTSGGPAT